MQFELTAEGDVVYVRDTGGLCAGCIQVEDDEQFFEDDEYEEEQYVGDDEHWGCRMRSSRVSTTNSRSFTQCATVQGSGA